MGEYCFICSFWNYSTVSMESTMLIPAIERNGIAVASRQAKMEITEVSAIAGTGTATSCKRCL